MHKHGGDIYGKDNIIDFSANINQKGIPEGIVKAALEGIRMSIHYPDVRCQELREGIAKKENLPVEYIRCGNGAADVIFSLVLAKKPKKALLPAPTFYEYEQALRAVECEIEYYYLKDENDFMFDEGYFDYLKDDIDIVFICNPNNPSGALCEKDYLKKVVKKCEEKDILLVLDECFNDLLDEPSKYSMTDELKETKNLFILKAFTKLYAMPGLRLGYGLSKDEELLAKIAEVSQPWSVSIPAQKAGIAALKEDRYVKESKAEIKKEREYLLKSFKRLGIRTFGSHANYIFFKAWDNLNVQCEEHGILIRDCSNYEGLTKGYYRIAVRIHEDNEKLISLLEKLMEENN